MLITLGSRKACGLSGGLLALLDDVAAIAKVAAASLDDVAAQTAKAGAKAMGIVIDDAAVTPRYVVGFAAERELPIVAKIARGSLRNKLLYLLPAALLLSILAPWAITPLLMAGGVFLCFEGYEKVHELFAAHPSASGPAAQEVSAMSPQALEDEKIAGAIRTDLILSAEIMAIALASVSASSPWTKAAVLAAVGVAITVLVYGAVALIVKADDVGAAMARGASALGRVVGRALVRGMPGFLKVLSLVGMLAMLWVGGGIVVHGLHEFGVKGPEELSQAVSLAVAGALGPFGGVAGWLVGAGLAGLLGLAIGWVAALGVAAMRK
jgi:uncharacterized protein